LLNVLKDSSKIIAVNRVLLLHLGLQPATAWGYRDH